MPWIGYFELIARSDCFVFLDSVQFERRSWQSRNRLRTTVGSPFWLTVPLEHTERETEIKNMRICERQGDWRKKHLNSIKLNLGRAPFFHQYFPILEYWLSEESSLIADLNIAIIYEISRLLGLHPKFVRSSDLNLTGQKADLLIAICNTLGATKYYSAAGSAVYIDPALFAEAGLALEFQTWQHPEYAQVKPPFVSHLSIIDALMNVGADETRRMILEPQAKDR